MSGENPNPNPEQMEDGPYTHMIANEANEIVDGLNRDHAETGDDRDAEDRKADTEYAVDTTKEKYDEIVQAHKDQENQEPTQPS